MNTPTPITDAAWSASFEGKQLSAGQTARSLRDCSQQLERELTALTAERDQLRASEARATAELRDSLALEQDMGNAAYDELRVDCDELRGDVVRLTADRDQLRAENATLRAAQKACEACDEPTAFEVRQLRAELAAERARSLGPRLAPQSPTETRPN